MTRRRSFTARNVAPNDALEIEVNGKTFPCRPKIAGITVLDFTSAMDEDDPAGMAKGMIDFLTACIEPAAVEEWNTFIHDPANDVDIDLLGEIVGYLTEEYTNRPLSQQDSSSDGSATSGPTPEEQPVSPV